jgi:uncharacterized membrane protein
MTKIGWLVLSEAVVAIVITIVALNSTVANFDPWSAIVRSTEKLISYVLSLMDVVVALACVMPDLGCALTT